MGPALNPFCFSSQVSKVKQVLFLGGGGGGLCYSVRVSGLCLQLMNVSFKTEQSFV